MFVNLTFKSVLYSYRKLYLIELVKSCNADTIQLLLQYLFRINKSSILYVGTWKEATWAIQFYEKFGFVTHKRKKTIELLKKHWKVSLTQIENSVVLEK